VSTIRAGGRRRQRVRAGVHDCGGPGPADHRAQWKGVERGVAVVTGRMLDLLPAALAGGPVTIDLDTTDVEVSADLPVMPRAVRLCCSVG
jgi:hypothetical protein